MHSIWKCVWHPAVFLLLLFSHIDNKVVGRALYYTDASSDNDRLSAAHPSVRRLCPEPRPGESRSGRVGAFEGRDSPGWDHWMGPRSLHSTSLASPLAPQPRRHVSLLCVRVASGRLSQDPAPNINHRLPVLAESYYSYAVLLTIFRGFMTHPQKAFLDSTLDYDFCVSAQFDVTVLKKFSINISTIFVLLELFFLAYGHPVP